MFIWHRIKCGVPQGSILGPVFLNLYMLYYADDTQVYIAVFSDDTAPIDTLLECILEIKSWMAENFLQLNKNKTDFRYWVLEAREKNFLDMHNLFRPCTSFWLWI